MHQLFLISRQGITIVDYVGDNPPENILQQNLDGIFRSDIFRLYVHGAFID
ncbi:hypothetical protein HZQ75_11370 [Elizabethkingia anophelis]|uniref:hypothetical protein n=1 Tax=Elizabethkingia anophelis TaxID=1117645 RepID=UPI0002D62963|nr:hypothetical protein [Elizabethkingia anophelis]KMU65397.1 hypothetical protein EZBTHKR_0166 [Elizabethkingia anophelis]MCQ0431020.1 hypothetical protein [Elizabethkingia anophelis]MCS7370216.1 hypothetical protein [Elizabethkingia anophelis]MCS7375607.1 hypothetical protein [Elizabethkingia anophelis]MCS7387872.1 hypothetical protein [Elizabethkingia anophelis]